MDDLIKRQDAIDALWKALYDYEDKTEKQFLESEELNTDDWFRHRIFVQNMSGIDTQTILTLPSAQQWIPCSERLPKRKYETQMRGYYLTTNVYGSVGLTKYEFEGGGLGYAWDSNIRIVAWMPLPSPYREEDTNNE